jgi:hypothetical protein
LALAAGYETNAQSLPGVRAFVGQPDTIPLPGRKSGAANPGCRRLSAGAPALFHEIPRAAGPLQQTAKTDRLFECPTLKADSSKQYCSEGGTVLRIAGGAVTPVRIRPIPFRAAGVF